MKSIRVLPKSKTNLKSNEGIKVFGSDLKITESNQKSQQYKCFWPKCHYKTNTKQQLEKHQSIDSNERKYICIECNKCFKRSEYLKNHRLIDSNERQFVCDWSQCGKRFNTRPSLRQHKLFVHLKERKFEFDYNNCEKKFFNKFNLEIHKRIHSGEKPFIAIKDSLKNHISNTMLKDI